MSTTESVILSNEPVHVHQTRRPASDNARIAFKAMLR